MSHDHREHLRRCVEAVRSQDGASTYPLAASVVQGDEVLSLECSVLPARPDPSAHPEMCAIRAAAARVESRYLPGAVLYTTIEPCPMCTSAAIWAKMDGIVYGVSQDEVVEFARAHATSALSWRQIMIPARAVVDAGTPRLWVEGGVLRDECLALLDLTAQRSAPESDG
jgi:tRNA(Arg) A34 adenosine deaminase TadA